MTAALKWASGFARTCGCTSEGLPGCAPWLDTLGTDPGHTLQLHSGTPGGRGEKGGAGDGEAPSRSPRSRALEAAGVCMSVQSLSEISQSCASEKYSGSHLAWLLRLEPLSLTLAIMDVI